MTDLHDELVERVQSHGVPQAVLARRAGLSEKHVSQMMTGVTEGRVEVWDRLLFAAEWGYEACRFSYRRGRPTEMG